MSKTNIVISCFILIILAVFGYIAYNYLIKYNFFVHTGDDFNKYDYVEFTQFKTENITDNTVRITYLDDRYLGIGEYGNNYLYIPAKTDDKLITEFSTANTKFNMVGYCLGMSLRTTYIEKLNKYCFKDFQTMQFITLPDTLTYIDDYFLYNCPYLTTIQFNSIAPPTIILDNSFVNCLRLSRIEVPKGSEDLYRAILPDSYSEIIFGVEPYERPSQNENTSKPYVQIFMDGEIFETITYERVSSFKDEYGISVEEMYPVLTLTDFNYETYYFDNKLNEAKLLTCYDIVCTKSNNFINVKFGNINYTVPEGWLNFKIEFFDLNTNFVNDSIYFEFDY